MKKIYKNPTKTYNENLIQKLGSFTTLSEGLDYAASGETGFNFYSSRGELDTVLPYYLLRREAIITARKLINCGLKRRDRVAVIAETSPDFMKIFFGCQYAGLIPCPMPYSLYIGGKDAYVERISGMMQSAGASMLIVPDDLYEQIEVIATKLEVEIITHSKLQEVDGKSVDLMPFTENEEAYIQYSSGSTSNPKGVLISQRAVTNNVRGILQDGLQVRSNDRSASWLPLYHDMGLVGFCLSPMMGQVSVDYLETSAFARRPVLWLKIISENKCTIAYSPTFGYDLVVRRMGRNNSYDLDLSSWRVAGIGGDMVRSDVLNEFANSLEKYGFNPRAFLPSYGMAEATLAVTFSSLAAPIAIDCVDRTHYKLSRRAMPVNKADGIPSERTRSFVVCGEPLPGHEVSIRDENGKRLGDREIGHIMLRGPSIMVGYYGNTDATSEVMDGDGWLDTGDMGYLVGGQLVVTGRSKDLILHNGRNIWPQDIEWAVERIEPLRSGDAAAFAIEGKNDEDEITVLVQCRVMDKVEMEKLRRKVIAAVYQQAGFECDVVLVPPRSLPFTSSGKLSRAAAKLRYLSGEIKDISKRYIAKA